MVVELHVFASVFTEKIIFQVWCTFLLATCDAGLDKYGFSLEEFDARFQ